MKPSRKPPMGYVTFTLHSHLPYVLNHGTWPHGEDWLHEAAAETYLPILKTLEDLHQRGTPLRANINLSPILLEQLAHPTFREAFPKYLQQKLGAARKDAEEFAAAGESHMVQVAEFWQHFYTESQRQFEGMNGDIVSCFKRFYDAGEIEIITCGATHGYFPLLGTDASIRAQVRMGVQTHQRFFGRKPRGIWLPECAYRPAGEWRFPVRVDGLRRPVLREGVEQILAECGIEFFFVDSHLVEQNILFTPYEVMAGDVPVAAEVNGTHGPASLYLPYYADGPAHDRARVNFFTRDPRTGIQVWSGEHGYPGDPVYLDFHKKRWPGGNRYWQVTHPKIDLGAKTPYFPDIARERTRIHAMHFSDVTAAVMREHPVHDDGRIPILTAPFDAELFGHWWFEGPEWLRHVAIEYAHEGHPLRLTTCAEYLDRYPTPGFVPLPEGSWGRNGSHEVWLNPATEWTWRHIYPAEFAVEQVLQTKRWIGHDAATRVVKQLCRELMLLESSDWQFLITTLHAKDYAEKRFQTHLGQFRELLDAWRRYEATGKVSGECMQRLDAIEQRDSVFPGLEPEIFS